MPQYQRPFQVSQFVLLASSHASSTATPAIAAACQSSTLSVVAARSSTLSWTKAHQATPTASSAHHSVSTSRQGDKITAIMSQGPSMKKKPTKPWSILLESYKENTVRYPCFYGGSKCQQQKMNICMWIAMSFIKRSSHLNLLRSTTACLLQDR